MIPTILALQKNNFSIPFDYNTSRNKYGWKLPIFLTSLVIGFRHEVGEDWKSYLRHVDSASYMKFEEILSIPDPAYFILNWIGANLGGGVYTVNIICGFLFSYGLFAFVKQLPRPSLSFVVSVPYLIIVVAMGYTRQGVAIGISMLALSYLIRKKVLRFLVSICLASLFHKSAILLLIFSLAIRTRNKFFTLFGILSLGFTLYFLLVLETINLLQANYLDYQLESEGASIRVAMNALPAAIFLVWRKRFIINSDDRRLWTLFSLIALLFILILQLSPSSTAVDRVGLYLIPLQIFVWSYFPDAFGTPGKPNSFLVFLVVLYYATVLFIWLNFATHSQSWLPYKFYFFEIL